MCEEDMRALEHLKERLRDKQREENEIIKRMEIAKERGDDKGFKRENYRLTVMTGIINRLTGDIFHLERKWGIAPNFEERF